ncbi:hypothetical protein BKK52_01105 [Rodentibacter trehalosifermentans]|uniref:DUF3560 domain-containing protein n=1 Tax=Rodentibacter trehalosifermentans TaxID=1908263 RepID=A0A1V3J6D7_9PAST|nr:MULTISPECIES: DUF3560 domain-containing protein [Rodentibacter]OOF50777.1 hypothetical protein BKK52_01105 [Rodentibacter trehalosifermentans]QIA76801.1 DUF3560 domain-containing protein [Rodentibacter heylii]
MITNTYAKFAPNVFVAKCQEPHKKGDIIVLTSRHGKEVEVEIHNLVKQSADHYFYSFTRCDGMDCQKRAEQRAQRYQDAAHNAMKRSHQYFEAAQEGREFLSMGEPIKIGHHSEKRHRALIDRNHRRMEKSVEEMRKAESYDDKIAYWESRAGKIDLSMPESLEFFQFELAKAKEKHQKLKDNPEKRAHPFSLTYAKKAVNELEKKVKLAEVLWA